MSDTSCIVLAGGRGTRMQGVDKGLVEYQGRALFEYVLERITPQVDDIIISANRNANRYTRYAPRVVADDTSGFHGPLLRYRQLPAILPASTVTCCCM